MPAKSVVETMRPLVIEPASKAPDFVLGLSIVRGVALPVVDLGRMLGSERAGVGRFITLKAGVRHLALAVQEVLGLRELSIEELPPLLSGASTEAIEALGMLDRELLFVLQSALFTSGGLLAELTVERPRS